MNDPNWIGAAIAVAAGIIVGSILARIRPQSSPCLETPYSMSYGRGCGGVQGRGRSRGGRWGGVGLVHKGEKSVMAKGTVGGEAVADAGASKFFLP